MLNGDNSEDKFFERIMCWWKQILYDCLFNIQSDTICLAGKHELNWEFVYQNILIIFLSKYELEMPS